MRLGASVLGMAWAAAIAAPQPLERQAFTIEVIHSNSASPNRPLQMEMRRKMAYRSDGSSVVVTLPGETERDGAAGFGDRAWILLPERLEIRVLDRLQLKTTDIRWKAPALNCLDLYGVQEWRSASGERYVSKHEVTRIVVGEPDPELFAVPVGYREVKPSEMVREQMAAFGRRSPTPELLEHLRSRDERYLKARPQ